MLHHVKHNACVSSFRYSLFKARPEYLSFFNFRPPAMTTPSIAPALVVDAPREVIEAYVDSMVDSARVRAHGSNVWYTMKMVFDNLDDEEMIDEVLAKMVRSHKRRAVPVTNFDDMPAAFNALLSEDAPYGTTCKLNSHERQILSKAFEHVVRRIQELYQLVKDDDNDN